MTNPNLEDREYQASLETSDVKEALQEYEGALARRDSISRKLCGGSTAVTVTDLARWEKSLSNARNTLSQLLHRKPILGRHPIFAAVAPHN